MLTLNLLLHPECYFRIQGKNNTYWVSLDKLRLNSTIRNSYIDLYWAFLWDLISRFSMLNYFPLSILISFYLLFSFLCSYSEITLIPRCVWTRQSRLVRDYLSSGRADCGLQVLEFVKLDLNLEFGAVCSPVSSVGKAENLWNFPLRSPSLQLWWCGKGEEGYLVWKIPYVF